MSSSYLHSSVRAPFLGAFLFVSFATAAANAADPAVPDSSSTSSDVIKWRSGVVTTTGAAAADAAGALSSAAAGGRRVVVQFNAPLTAAQQAALDVAGVKLLSYLSNNAYFARVDAARFDAAAVAASTLKTALPVELGWKLSPILMADQVPGWSIVAAAKQPDSKDDPAVNELHAIDDDMIVAVYAMFHKDVDLNAEAVPLAVRYGASVVGSLQGAHALVLELPATAIKPLTGEDALLWIEPPLPRFEELNDSNRARVQANQLQGAPYGLDGTGVGVLVYDGGKVRATHQDFGGRVTLGVGDASPQSSHSTHVAGTIGGSGAASAGLRKGMAPNVSIVSYGLEQVGGLHQGFLYNDPCDIEADYGNAINTYDAHIANNSIGTNTSTNGYPCTWQGDYGVTDTVIDAIVRGSLSGGTPFRIVWANGNERQSTRCQNLPPPFQQYHLTAPPACAKNHIAVGALNSNDDSMTTFSSWGPADDGRLKPDISAPGCESGGDAGVTSCSSSSDTSYASLCGTSMASPTTCGVGALLLQDFRAQFPGEPDFRNSTLKILLAHTAVDLGTPGPDFQFGYGSIRGQAAVDFMRTGNFAENSVPGTGNSVNYVVVVQPGDTLMKVTIAWDDPPGTPNVSPALVNDLDLVVTSPGGTRFYPWTHGGLANPAAAAVQTQENHLDNIEQVLVNNPQVGSWQIEVRGTAVPSGPQPFSIAAGPFLVNCSSIGSISLNADEYNCSSSATLRVVDCDLNTDAGAIETVNVTINSTSEPAGETVLLTEVAPDGATFVGTISLSTTNAAGVLHIAHADTVTATYLDASDGQGGFNILRTDTATVDCVGPIISNVQVINLAAHSATVTFNTDETAQGTVRYGTACGSLSSTSQGSANTVSHSFSLSGLTDNTTYFFAADAVDPAGNASSDDNGGQCFTFTTAEIPDYFTQLFSTALGTNDLDNQQFLFVPNGTVDRYAACREPNMTQFPTDPSGHMPIVFPGTQDDQFVAITLTGGQQVLLYGVPYSTFYVGSNGYITFNSGDTDNTESLTDHFEQPHISLLFDNLNPATAGQVSWAQLADRAVVTFNNVAEDVTTNPPLNSFQCEMFYDGRIRVTFLNVGITDGLFGLSAGQTTPADYTPSDFTLYGACGPRPPTATGSTVGTPAGAPVLIELIASDDGLPAPPALTYTILSLPAFGVLSDPNGGPINAVPYTLIAGGDTVRYGPPGIQSGTVTFDFKANDGGVPPEGGDSGTATVTVNIADPNTPQPIHEFLVDDTQPAGWTWDADWAFGDPAGLSGDPQTGFTGVNVLGYNLNGAYPNSLAPVRYLRTTAIDCTNLSQVTLQFMRWLGIESATFDHATIDASTDGMAWTNVWTHTGETLNNPTSWTMVSYSLAAIADDQPTVYLRWGMGTTDVSVAYCGWNIDDILILGVLPGGTLLGDLNCDGEVNILDINAFILAITDPAAYAAAYPDCNINLADCNGDGDENILDINPFISLLGG